MTELLHNQSDPVVRKQAERRRTFAIISHPDAGKTTLTEKLLLYAGAVDVAGTVRGRKTQRAATSDWMELERQRGISVSSTALSFEYEDYVLNLLDTPGHQDFSEDTYRTLMAADCAVMVIDLAKGVEPQTEKLFKICAQRGIPIITFVNKVDRPGKEPLALLTEIEAVLGIEAVPYNWPIGTGFDFCGIYECLTGKAEIFQQGQSGSLMVESKAIDLNTPNPSVIKEDVRDATVQEIELVKGALPEFNEERFLRGNLTPVFFGSALNNFGVERFLHSFIKHAPSPTARNSDVGLVNAHRPHFSGFIFKIQANLDPKHRDRIAYLRVCSGKFIRDMEIVHPRTKKKLRLKRAHRLFAQSRETMDEAFPGDILGLVNPGEFFLGDTICEEEPVMFEALPSFSPENFAILSCKDTMRRKQFERGLSQLVEEGAIQTFRNPNAQRSEPILGAVGELQFDVVQFRLKSEYEVDTSIEWLQFKIARWVHNAPANIKDLKVPYSGRLVTDRDNNWVVLMNKSWDLQYCFEHNPGVSFDETSSPVKAA